jgi:cytochrome c-type biogenesis protein CcmH
MARAAAIVLAALLAMAGPAAAQADRPLADPKSEQRAIDLHKELRCLVCQNQAISDSNADLARQLRQIVRERIAAGDSNDQVKAHIVERYGDWVLMQPPFKWSTLVLWLGPAVLLLLAATVGFRYSRRQRVASADGPLSNDERSRLARILDRDDGAKP